MFHHRFVKELSDTVLTLRWSTISDVEYPFMQGFQSQQLARPVLDPIR